MRIKKAIFLARDKLGRLYLDFGDVGRVFGAWRKNWKFCALQVLN